MKPLSRNGLTLVELMVAMALSLLVLGGVLGTVLFISRTSIRISNYSVMEQQTTRSLELLARELRMAQSVTSSGSPITQITLAVPNATSGSYNVAYTYNSTTRTFSRQQAGHSATIIVSDIVPGAFSLQRYDYNQQPATTDYDTKQLQITMTLSPDNKGLVASTSKRVISSRFVLRNR